VIPVARFLEPLIGAQRVRNEQWHMKEKLPVVRRIRAVEREVDDLARIEPFRGRVDDGRRRLILLPKAEPRILQLGLAAHERADAEPRVLQQLGKIACERMIEVPEIEPPSLEEVQREHPKVRVEETHQVALNEGANLVSLSRRVWRR
jgi:hypothetical protein